MKALTVTASIVLSVLVVAVGWLFFFPGPDAGDPVVTVAVTPPPAPNPAPPAPASNLDLPPGFGITSPPAAHPGQPEGSPPLPQSAPGQPPADLQQTAAVPAQPRPGQSPPPSETASVTLVNAPVPELVEESQYGPLPKVAPDGRRALDVYARPSEFAGKVPQPPPRVAVLVNGLGPSDSETIGALKGLPASISVAYGAYGRNLQDWVVKARAIGHEVFLQIPLEPVGYPETNDPGPHTLLTTLPADENMKRLQWLMSRFTGYVGVTNQMGAKFEATQDALLPVLEEMKARGLLFVDDGTSKVAAPEKVASAAPKSQGETVGTPPAGSPVEQIGAAIGLDYAVANVQIDAVQSPADIAKALSHLETLAKEQGVAIGVASAKPATVKQLAAWAAQLKDKGIVLIPVSAAVRSQRQS